LTPAIKADLRALHRYLIWSLNMRDHFYDTVEEQSEPQASGRAPCATISRRSYLGFPDTVPFDACLRQGPAAEGRRGVGTRAPRCIGRVVVPEDEYAPVIVEVMSKKEAKILTYFAGLVLANKPTIANGLLTRTGIYGDTFTFDTNQKKTPTINGKPVDYEQKQVNQSPFLNADYNAGSVTITKG